MAKLAILASGNGSNFEAITQYLRKTEHDICCLICDRKNAFAFKRAEKLGIPSFYVGYVNKSRTEAEKEITRILKDFNPDLIALAGYMRLLGEIFISEWENKIVNIHPALLPSYPGTESIKRAFEANEEKLGITIHYVDKGMDTGPIIRQESFNKDSKDSLNEVETKVHQLEHQHYPQVIEDLLNQL